MVGFKTASDLAQLHVHTIYLENENLAQFQCKKYCSHLMDTYVYKASVKGIVTYSNKM